jgi:hypothetical protein
MSPIAMGGKQHETFIRSKGESITGLHTTEVLQISFVADKHDDNICVCMVSKLLEPFFYILI